jgi:hypothetical protein
MMQYTAWILGKILLTFTEIFNKPDWFYIFANLAHNNDFKKKQIYYNYSCYY